MLATLIDSPCVAGSPDTTLCRAAVRPERLCQTSYFTKADAGRPQVRDKLAEGAAAADPLAAGGHTIRDYQPAAVPVASSRQRRPDRDLEVCTRWHWGVA